MKHSFPYIGRLSSGENLSEMQSMVFLIKVEGWTRWQINSNSAIKSSYLDSLIFSILLVSILFMIWSLSFIYFY